MYRKHTSTRAYIFSVPKGSHGPRKRLVELVTLPVFFSARKREKEMKFYQKKL